MTILDSPPPAEAVVIASGGLDSTTLVYHLRAQGSRMRLLSFDYGQRHRKELESACQIAEALGLPHHVLDLRPVGALLAGSALTDPGVGVPDGHYTDESMRATVVPNRNALMLDVAVGVAVANGCDAVAFGAHGGDHAIYPDCRPEFVDAFTTAARLGNAGFLVPGFRIFAPFLLLSKTDIVRLGAHCGVPFERTWSCYKGGTQHCGRCGTCTERREAFQQAGLPDPTTYEAA
ncbi:MAG: 7-cyano-7-deazaguanine synthase QueC [Streptosporangiaceae bacterium]